MSEEQLVICSYAASCDSLHDNCMHRNPHVEDTSDGYNACAELVCDRMKVKVKCIPLLGDWDK